MQSCPSKRKKPAEPPPYVPRTSQVSSLGKGWSYTKAVTRWTAAGFPVRSQEEIDRIFTICEACPHYVNDKRPHCRLCGCSLSKAPEGLKNKIAMATESCPDKRWGPSE